MATTTQNFRIIFNELKNNRDRIYTPAEISKITGIPYPTVNRILKKEISNNPSHFVRVNYGKYKFVDLSKAKFGDDPCKACRAMKYYYVKCPERKNVFEWISDLPEIHCPKMEGKKT